MLSFLDPSKSQLLSQSYFDLIEDNIPIIKFDKHQTKLEHIKEAQGDAVKF